MKKIKDKDDFAQMEEVLKFMRDRDCQANMKKAMEEMHNLTA